MQISKDGIALIKKFEGCRLKAYKALKTEEYYTIGYGHYDSDVKVDAKITQTEADELLRSDIKKFERHVNDYNTSYNYHFTQPQFDALVSFAFNVGSIRGLTRNGQRTKDQISRAFLLYNKRGSRILRGLVRRRNAEKALFDRGSVSSQKELVIAHEVVEGLWGNGLDRKRRLTLAGHDYKKVQTLVNKIMKGEL